MPWLGPVESGDEPALRRNMVIPAPDTSNRSVPLPRYHPLCLIRRRTQADKCSADQFSCGFAALQQVRGRCKVSTQCVNQRDVVLAGSGACACASGFRGITRLVAMPDTLLVCIGWSASRRCRKPGKGQIADLFTRSTEL